MSYFKIPRFRSKKLTDSARDEPCTLEVIGICNHDVSTSVLAHLPDDSGTGKMGGKSDDWCAVIACSNCHQWLDSYESFQKDLRDWYMRRAQIRTWRRWIQKGLVKIS